VASFGYDERTIAKWERRAGAHCQQLHEHLVQQGQVDLQHVQADELWVKLVGQRLWLAMALAVPSRLWLGGVLGASRDAHLLARVVARVRAAGKSRAILVCVDGLAGYVSAFRRGFRTPQPTGQPGRPQLVEEAGLLMGQVVKR
jgi:transposase-like protein